MHQARRSARADAGGSRDHGYATCSGGIACGRVFLMDPYAVNMPFGNLLSQISSQCSLTERTMPQKYRKAAKAQCVPQALLRRLDCTVAV
ncbi:hypothetical protein L1887_60385 [Cichorium endivia]|nr:hypothetical protein L1887_60385 [Cichorium endivia]